MTFDLVLTVASLFVVCGLTYFGSFYKGKKRTAILTFLSITAISLVVAMLLHNQNYAYIRGSSQLGRDVEMLKQQVQRLEVRLEVVESTQGEGDR